MERTIQPTQDATTGRSSYTEGKQFVDKKGFAIDPTFVFIDSRTGDQLYSETCTTRTSRIARRQSRRRRSRPTSS